MVQQARRRKVTVSPGSSKGPGYPEPDQYIFTFLRIVDFALGKGYEDREPQEQFTLEFQIDDYDDPKTGEPMLIRGWYTPKLHAIDGYPEPKLYKLVKAMNGGIPLELPTDEDGEPLEYDAWELLEPFIGSQFRCNTTLNRNGWARMSADPLPMRARRQPPKPKARVVEDAEEAEDSWDETE
jgi:hypothetical protein